MLGNRNQKNFRIRSINHNKGNDAKNKQNIHTHTHIYIYTFVCRSCRKSRYVMLFMKYDSGRGIILPHPAEPIYGYHYLPRKFKIGVTVPGDNSLDIYANDIAVVVIVNDKTGELESFNVMGDHRYAFDFAHNTDDDDNDDDDGEADGEMTTTRTDANVRSRLKSIWYRPAY